MWQKFAQIIGRPDLVSDPEQCTMANRVKRRTELDTIVADWVSERTVAEVQKLMDAADLPCAPILDTAQIVADPHMQSRQMTVDVEQVLSGTLKMPGTVFKMSETPGDPYPSAPFLGEHNSEIYSDLLGYSEDRINELMAQEVI